MKKMIAFIMSVLMLVGMSVPVFATQNEEEVKTVEEILNGYHAKAFERQTNQETKTAGTNSRSGGSAEKSLEEETVEELTAAGYEAYNVTSSNYDELEASLNTDFEDLGLDPNDSYIIVISGEESEDQPNPNSRSGSLPDQDHIDDGGTSFTYTYGGTTYSMRYLTVTAAGNSALAQTDDVELLHELNASSVLDFMYDSIVIIASTGHYFGLGTTISLISPLVPDFEPTYRDAMDYQACSNWTVIYTQIYDVESESWTARSSVEYVKMRHYINYTYYVAAINDYEQYNTGGVIGTFYSAHYSDSNWRKEYAVLAYEQGYRMYDVVEEVDFKFGNTVVKTHQRWMEYWGYEP